jgi:hypothetical protein
VVNVDFSTFNEGRGAGKSTTRGGHRLVSRKRIVREKRKVTRKKIVTEKKGLHQQKVS